MKTLLYSVVFVLILLIAARGFSQSGEDAYNAAFCASVEGETEMKHYYDYPTGRSYVRVDCETADMVYEGGLDKRSSLDSLQQAGLGSSILCLMWDIS